MANIIGRISIQPAAVRPCEPVRVEVFDKDDQTLNGSQVQVWINGVPGALQFLQFPGVGQRRLVVRARTAGGESELQVAPLEVQGEPLQFPTPKGGSDIAMLGVTQSPTQPYTAVLTLGSSLDTRAVRSLGVGQSASALPYRALAHDSLAARLTGRGALGLAMSSNPQALRRVETRRLTKTRAARSRPAAGSRRSLKPETRFAIGAVYDLTEIDLRGVFNGGVALSVPEFEWDFGDGTSATTHTPVVSHDYFAAIDHAAGLGQFTVTCHVKQADITVRRTLTIHSAYAICKSVGTVVPHVTADIFAHKRHNMLTGAFTVHNVEDAPIVLDRMSLTPTAEEGDALALPRPFVKLDYPVTIPARSATMVSVNVPFVLGTPTNGELRFDVKGFSVVYAGTVGALPVRCSAVFDVPVPEWRQKPHSPMPPNIPLRYRKPWPWELVERDFEAVVNPVERVGRRGDAVLDTKTGTLAFTLGQLRSTEPRAVMREQGFKVLSAVYTPVETIMETRPPAVPAAQYLPRELTRQIKRREREVERRRGIPAPVLWLKSLFTPVLALFRLLLSVVGFVANIFKVAGQPPLPGIGFATYSITGPPTPGPIAEGQVCDPDQLGEDDLAAADAGQLVCQLTSEVADFQMPARWMNARKGDCILSPGGAGFIGGLMLNVKPAQWYSHTGIMTRNYDEITHSTGSQSRLMDHLTEHLFGLLKGTDGFEPSVLKYIWPGAVTQTVQNSIEGESFPDPEYDESYSISSFGPHAIGVTHNDQFKMIPPLVLKPDPLQETSEVRTALHAIATDARNDAGRPGVKPKYHYRWYCYTDPTIGLGAPEGPEAGWAAGTRPSVCSSYIWLHAKARNGHLETSQALVTPTDLEPSDIAQGAVVRPTTPDGLYTYSAEERSAAAHWLYDTIYNQGYEKAGWFGNALTDAADDVANQFLNAFANDDADGKDSDAWQKVKEADAVSPDNMLWWDGPALGGLYGYAEPALYREPRVENYTVSRWKKVLSRGTVRGTVFGPDGPVAGATVQVHEGKGSLPSGADGSYTINDVGLGDYMLKGSKVIDGVSYSAQVRINLNAAELVADIHLQPPAERFRLAQIFIDFWGRDEETFGDDEIMNPAAEYYELELGPDKPVNSMSRTYHWGGEMRVEYSITLRLLVNNVIDVEVLGKLYEGTSEDTEDLDGQGGISFQAGVGQTTGSTLTITNTDEDAGDGGVLNISVKNVRNNN